MAMEITLPQIPVLPDGHPDSRTTFQGPDGRQNMVIDTRPPLYRMRRRDLMRLAEQQGFDVSGFPLKDDLIRMLEAPRSVKAQLTGGRTLGEVKQQAAVRQAHPPKTRAQPAAPTPNYVPRQPEPHEVEAAREQARAELMKMPYFSLRAVLATRGIEYGTGAKGDRGQLVEEYLRAVERDEGEMLSSA